MELTEKQIIEKAKFLIADHEAYTKIPSFLPQWHKENAIALAEMLDGYTLLNMLERISLRETGLSLTELFEEYGLIGENDKKVLRRKRRAGAKRRAKRKAGGEC